MRARVDLSSAKVRHHTGRDDVNERFYDFDAGYSFNMAEFSIKKDPSDRYPFGYGLVVTGGLDAQKNHAIGIFRDKNDDAARVNQGASSVLRGLRATALVERGAAILSRWRPSAPGTGSVRRGRGCKFLIS